MSFICLLIPGHQTDSRALSRHLRIPWWPAWILSNMSKRRDEGMVSLESFIRRPLWNVIQALSGQKDLSAYFSFDLSGHPSVLNSCSFRHTSSSCWWSRNLRSVAGKPSRMLATYKFRSSLSRMSVFVGDFLSGGLESVSAMIKSFPGMWQMLDEYSINLILNLWNLGGSSSKFFNPSSGTNGWWSVSMRMSIPWMKSLNFSHAQFVASASFSIWAYLCSVLVKDLDAYTTGFLAPFSCSCRSTAPSS